MISTTHYAFSFLLTSAAGAGTETALSASLLSLLPDIDHPHSIAGRMFPGLSKWILRKYGHRTVTHSLFAIAAVAAIFSPLIPLSASMKGGSGVSLYLYLLMAYASHILIDIFNYSGVRLLAPFSHKEYISFRTPSFRLPVSSSKEHVLLLVIVTLAILTAGRTFSASGAVRSIGKIFYKNYTTAIEDYRNNSMFVCKAKLRYFDHVSRSIVSDEYPVLNLFQDEIILMDNSRDDPRLVIPRDDIQEIEVVATQTHLRTNSISGLDPKLLHEVPPGAFVSGSITVHNFNPGIVPNRFVKVSQGVNTVILSYSSALTSELSRIAAPPCVNIVVA